jgi:ATP-dependent protease Clp ATPase subunit
MYDLPSLDDVVRCVVDRDAIEGSNPPELFDDSNNIVVLPPHPYKKSA